MNMPPEGGTDLFVVWVGSDWNLLESRQVARVSLLTRRNGHSKA